MQDEVEPPGMLRTLDLWRGGEDVLLREALFFTGAAFVTFGGAYVVLGYIANVAVNGYGWLGADQMVQGLAESTPGPLIMVTQYVGFLRAWKFSGPFDLLLCGILGALTATYVTFLPCFLFIFLRAAIRRAAGQQPPTRRPHGGPGRRRAGHRQLGRILREPGALPMRPLPRRARPLCPLRACANRPATFHTCWLRERLHSLPTVP